MSRYITKLLDEEARAHMRSLRSMVKQGPEPHCDFCGALNPVLVYAACRLSTGENKECWRWCACKPCSLAIEKGDWLAIEQKIAAWLATQVDMPYADRLTAARLSLWQFHRDVLITRGRS